MKMLCAIGSLSIIICAISIESLLGQPIDSAGNSPTIASVEKSDSVFCHLNSMLEYQVVFADEGLGGVAGRDDFLYLVHPDSSEFLTKKKLSYDNAYINRGDTYIISSEDFQYFKNSIHFLYLINIQLHVNQKNIMYLRQLKKSILL